MSSFFNCAVNRIAKSSVGDNNKKAIATYNEKTTRSMLLPTDKKNVREFILKNRITIAQKENILNKFGWTMDNWEDGSLL